MTCCIWILLTCGHISVIHFATHAIGSKNLYPLQLRDSSVIMLRFVNAPVQIATVNSEQK